MICVEVVYAEADRQKLVALHVTEGTTAKEAVVLSGIEKFFPNLSMDTLELGIFSLPCALDYLLCDGDRVEIYRPLLCDPKEMRRKRAQKSHTI